MNNQKMVFLLNLSVWSVFKGTNVIGEKYFVALIFTLTSLSITHCRLRQKNYPHLCNLILHYTIATKTLTHCNRAQNEIQNAASVLVELG